MHATCQLEEFDVRSLVQGLPQRAVCKIYEEALKQITLEDEITAKVLLGITKNKGNVVSSSLVSNSLESEPEISKQITKETIEGMIRMKDSPFEERGRIRDIISFSFRDPNFQRYILMRNAGLETPPDFLVGKWKLTYGSKEDPQSEIATILANGAYYVDDRHRFNSRNFSSDSSTKVLLYDKVLLDGTVFHRESITLIRQDLLEGHRDGDPKHLLRYERQLQ